MGQCNSVNSKRKQDEKFEGSASSANIVHNTIEKINYANNVLLSEQSELQKNNIKSGFAKIEHPTKVIKDLELLKKHTPFLPHNYNSFTKEDIVFYKKVINVKNVNIHIDKSIYSMNDLKSFLEEVNMKMEADDKEFKKMQICWKLFCWIIKYIKNDEHSLLYDKHEEYTNASLDSLMANKSGNSFGIAKLYQTILDHFKIENIIISGYIKGKQYKKGSDILYVNHSWSGVMIYGEFRLIDCSSACDNSPYSDDRKYNEFFYCTPPHHLIYTHYPENISHSFLQQGSVLLEKPNFEKLALLIVSFLYIYSN